MPGLVLASAIAQNNPVFRKTNTKGESSSLALHQYAAKHSYMYQHTVSCQSSFYSRQTQLIMIQKAWNKNPAKWKQLMFHFWSDVSLKTIPNNSLQLWLMYFHWFWVFIFILFVALHLFATSFFFLVAFILFVAAFLVITSSFSFYVQSCFLFAHLFETFFCCSVDNIQNRKQINVFDYVI